MKAEISRALKSPTIKDVSGGRMITECLASFSCIATLLIPADHFAVLRIAYIFVTDEAQ